MRQLSKSWPDTDSLLKSRGVRARIIISLAHSAVLASDAILSGDFAVPTVPLTRTTGKMASLCDPRSVLLSLIHVSQMVSCG